MDGNISVFVGSTVCDEKNNSEENENESNGSYKKS